MKVTIQTAHITDKGLNPRYTVNEDSFLVMETERIFAVADGVGGGDKGDLASRSALKIISNGVKKFSGRSKGDRIDFIQKLIKAGNEAVYQIGQEMKKNLASTIVIMSVEDDYAVLGHVGDSRIYLIRNDKLLRLTNDHSKLQELLDRNPHLSITRDEYPDGHVITRALGAEEDVNPDIQKIFLKDKDIFILCSDGIYTCNSTDDMLESVNGKSGDLNIACATLKNNCYKRGAKDNLTAILIRVAMKA